MEYRYTFKQGYEEIDIPTEAIEALKEQARRKLHIKMNGLFYIVLILRSILNIF